MLALFIFAVTSALKQCTIVIKGSDSVSNIDGVLSNGCDHIEINGITTATMHGEIPPAFCDLKHLPTADENDRGYITFTDCDASHSGDLISSSDNPQNLDIVIKQTKLSVGFTGQLAVNKVSVIDCVIDITAISNMMENLVAKNIVFSNCVFMGKISKDFVAIFNIGFYGLKKISEFNIEFVDCEFNLDTDWKSKTVNDALVDDPRKQFITVDLDYGIKVSIKFVRCYSHNSQLTSFDMIKVSGSEEDMTNQLSVEGENNGFSVKWSRVDTRTQLLTENSVW